MKRKKVILWFSGIITGGFLVLCAGIYARFGGGEEYPDLSTTPGLPAEALEVAVRMKEPVGNVAVSPAGRIFVTIHPESRPETVKLVEIVDGEPRPYPDLKAQEEMLTPLGVVVRAGRLWVVDHGFHGFKGARLYAFDLDTGKKVLEHRFDSDIAGAGSFAQDLQVSTDGKWVFIAELSVFGGTPALIVYNSETDTARRVLENHVSVAAENYKIRAYNKEMIFLGGLFTLKPAVDTIALDPQDEWLYYGPMSGSRLYRIRTRDLEDAALNDGQLAARVEDYGPKPLSDGGSVDDAGTVYITDVEHRSIMTLDPSGQLKTLIRSELLRWPDALSFGPDGYLYIADSSIPDQMMRSKDHIEKSAPYFIYRVRVGTNTPAGQ